MRDLLVLLVLLISRLALADASTPNRPSTPSRHPSPAVHHEIKWKSGSFQIYERFAWLWEGPRLFIRFDTDESYGCFNYPIDGAMTVNATRVAISLGDVLSTDGCLTAVGSASWQSELRLPHDSFQFELSHDGKVDTYSVTLTADKVRVVPQRTQFSRWRGGEVDRIARDVVWTHCMFTGGQGLVPEPGLCESFFDEVARYATRIGQRDRQGAIQLAWKYEGDLEPLMSAMRRRTKDGYYMLVGSGRGYTLVCAAGKCRETPGYMPSRTDVYR